MSTQLATVQQTGIADRTSAPAQTGMACRHRATAALPDPAAGYRRPACLLAIAIHELGRTSAALVAALASHNEALAGRLEREQEGWSHLYEFTCQRICAPLREEGIDLQAASVYADAALAGMPATVPEDILAYLRYRLAACATYRTADDCPFLNPADDRCLDGDCVEVSPLDMSPASRRAGAAVKPSADDERADDHRIVDRERGWDR